MSVRAAVVQLESGADPDANLASIAGLVAAAAAAGAALVVLPENCALMADGDAARLARAEDDGAGPIQDALARIARGTGVWLVGGTLPLRAPDGRAYASCLVFGPDGARVARYDKVHLFDVEVPGGERHRESGATAPGAAAVVVDTPCGCLGLSVCYDLRFPELYRALVDRGATLFAVPAAFTAITGAAHWEVLLRARAIEDQCFVLAAAQHGSHPGGRRTHGHSTIVDPWGEVLAQRPHGPGIAVADIDPDRLVGLRQRFPVLGHRRPL